MKTKEELNALKEEAESLNRKLAELTEEELAEVVCGLAPGRRYWYQNSIKGTSEHDEQILQTYPKDIGSDKNAKVIFN